MKRYVIAVDADGKAYLRRTVTVVRELNDSEQTYTVVPVSRPKRLSMKTRADILNAVANLLAMTPKGGRR